MRARPPNSHIGKESLGGGGCDSGSPWLLGLADLVNGPSGSSEMRVFCEPGERLRSGLSERAAVLHYTPMSRAKHLILRDVARLARGRELTVTWLRPNVVHCPLF
jgi:hypothetical protein